jgi:hypothetical protein
MRYVGVAAIAAPLAIGRLLAQLPAMHAEDNGLAVDFTVTTPRQTPDPAISAPLRPRGVAPQRRGAGSDRRPGAASRGSTGRPQEGRKEAPQPRRDLSGTRTPAKPSRRATGPGFTRPDPSSAEATARRDQLGHRARLDLSEPCFQQPRV